MTPSLPVTVVVDGRLVAGARDAYLRHGVVAAPLDPYARALATTVAAQERGRIKFERGGRTFAISLGSRIAFAGTAAVSLPIAPYLRAGEPIIPLAAVARALGAYVTYHGATHTLDIETQPPPPLSTPTPFASWSPPPGELPTFTPHATPTPRPTISGIPYPRRTPILVPPDGARPKERVALCIR